MDLSGVVKIDDRVARDLVVRDVEVDAKGADLPKKVRNRCAAFFFPIGIPEVAIEKGDDKSRAEKEQGGGDMSPSVRLDAVERGGSVKCKRQAEELKENAKTDAGPPLEQTADRQRREIGRDEDDHRHDRPFGLEKL